MGLTRVLSEFCAVLRRDGIDVSPVEAIDVQRAALAVGLSDRSALGDAISSVVVKKKEDLRVFERAFDAFFRLGGHAGARTFFDRLRARGFQENEIAALAEMLGSFGAMSEGQGGGWGAAMRGDAVLEALLIAAGRGAKLDAIQSPMQVGFFSQRVLERAGVTAFSRQVPALRAALVEALGDRGEALAREIEEELDRARRASRDYVAGELARRTANTPERFRADQLAHRPFATLSADEMEEVEREIRRFAERFEGAVRVRRKRARRGVLDLRRTLRRANASLGVPFVPVVRKKRRDRPKLIVICDVSDSVRVAARFLLILAYALQELFSRTRTFVFVSDLAETTALFERLPIHEAIQTAYGGGVVNTASNSHYGHALSEFLRAHGGAVDGRTTVVVVGDARSNYTEPRADVLRSIASRARRLIWLNPEPPGAWGFGDSVMPAYAPHCDAVLPVYDLASLREATRRGLSD